MPASLLETAMDITTLKNRQIRLAKRPVGMPGPECWQQTEEAVA